MEVRPEEITSSGTVYILHGDDEIAIKQFVQKRIDDLGDSEMADMNITRLDGKILGEFDLSGAIMVMPFFTSKRLVILSNPLAKLESRKQESSEEGKESGKLKEHRARFLQTLEDIPESSELILIIDDHERWKGGGMQWESLSPKHFLSKWIAAHPRLVKIHSFPLPTQNQMPGWIQKKAKEMGGKFSLPAAVELASYVSTDTRLATLEIDKLITYCGYRQVDPEDVMTLSTSIASSSIWDFTDAIGGKDIRLAQRIFHQLLETLDLRGEIFPMVIWQFRQLLLSREIIDEGGSISDLIQGMHIAEFQAKKLYEQAKRFSMAKLKWVYRRLMEIEEASKGGATGETSVDLSVLIDQLIVELA